MPLFHSGTKMNPTILFIILVVAIVFFLSGLVLLLVKLLKKQILSSIFQSNRHLDMSSSNAFQRQLQQLFHIHDSGLDQALIDVLPMFIYKDVVGLSGPFDCPVCLSEFSHEDKLRLLPLCKHAFHLHCIDTWLLSNSTCPLCRGTLFTPGFSIENPDSDLDDSRNAEGFSVNAGANVASDLKPAEPNEIASEKRVVSVRLGKFRHTNEEERTEDIEMGETSNINLDARRCFSMGSVQYVVADTEFQVALCPDRGRGNEHDLKIQKGNQNDGKKISKGSKRESFSISKVWLWPKKSKITNDRENHFSRSIISFPNRTRSSRERTPASDTEALAGQVFSSDEFTYDSPHQLNSTSTEKSNLDGSTCNSSRQLSCGTEENVDPA